MIITAELGTAWCGDITKLDALMKSCKNAGFDAVKLQAFKKEHLNSRYWRLASSVNPWNVEVINDLAHERKIKWYCTPCYPEAVDFLKPYMDTWKIRYKDSLNPDIFESIWKTDPKEVFISCDNPLRFRESYPTVKSLYCISKYPHGIHEVDWNTMTKFSGWSCHCPSKEGLKSAAILGIKYLEIHVRPSYIDDKEKYADYDVSFDLYHLKETIDAIRIVSSK